MPKTNYLLCPGDACPFRFACARFGAWLDNDDDDPDEMAPAYDFKKKTCDLYSPKEYYGG